MKYLCDYDIEDSRRKRILLTTLSCVVIFLSGAAAIFGEVAVAGLLLAVPAYVLGYSVCRVEWVTSLSPSSEELEEQKL